MKKINSFLKHFCHDGNSPVILVGHPQPNHTVNMQPTFLDDALEQNKEGKDIYFIPNIGQMSVSTLKYLTCAYVDLDAGRDEGGRYFNYRLVADYKKDMWKEIESFKPHPSFVVESRNGYHVYWLLKPVDSHVKNLVKWNMLEHKICDWFAVVGSDKNAIRCTQILRLPYTTWYKPSEEMKKFKTSVVKQNLDKRYDLEDLLNVFYNLPSREKERPSRTKHGSGTLQWTRIGWYGIIDETVEFLKNVSECLDKQGMTYLAKHAKHLSKELDKKSPF